MTRPAERLEMDRAEEVQAKLEPLRGWLDHNDLDGVVIASQGGFAWITGGGDNHVTLADEVGAASVLVTEDEAYLLAANNELDRLVEEEVSGAGFIPVEWPWHDDAGEGQAVERLCDPSRTVCDVARHGLPVAPPDLAELRFTLLMPELLRYQELGRDAAEAVEGAALTARPGDRELDVAARLAYECRRRGIVALVTLVGADDRIARYRHPLPTERRLDRTLMVSLTGRRWGLHASLTRMVHYGPVEADLARRQGAVQAVDARFISESVPGASLGRIFDAAVEQYRTEGYPDEWRLHHQGGLTGYAGREIFANSTVRHPLRPGQVVAWNPTITGVKSEDTVLVGAERVVALTRTTTWPQSQVEMPGGTVERPALLRRS